MRTSAGESGEQTPAAEAGVTGNARLTAVTGSLLTLLLLVEGFTIMDVRGYITLHTAVGLTVIGPVALKCMTTMYRFLRYYTGATAYVIKEPPSALLRVIGPLLVLSSIAVLASGIALLIKHSSGGVEFTLHKGSFIVWVVVMSVHFLGHLRQASVETVREMRGSIRDPARRGRGIRTLVVGISLVAGVAVAAAFTPSASSWRLNHDDHALHGS